MINTLHCASARAIHTCTAPPPTHPLAINLYHFKGSVKHRPPLLHPDSPLEQICTPREPLRGHCHRSLQGVCTAASAETPSSSPLHGREKLSCCTHIHTVMLSQILIEGVFTLHGSTGLQYGEWPWPFFQDLTSRKNIFHTLVRWMRGLKDALFKRFRPYVHNMGGDPRMFGTAGCCPEIRHTTS